MASARPDTWMPIYWGDYAKDTGHLSAAHHGAYLMLIKHYWVTGLPLPIDDAQLWRIACADSLAHWRKMKAVVLAFFEERDGALHHGRVEREMEAAGRNADRRVEMARRASAARWGRQGGGNPGGSAPSTPSGNAPRMRQASADDGADHAADTNSAAPENSVTGTQPIEKSGKTDAPRMPDAMPGHSPPPSPSSSTIDVTNGVLSHFDEPPPPESQASEPVSDHLDIPDFLRRQPARMAHSIAPDWLPSQSAQDHIAKLRPDLTAEVIQQRMEDFRTWCAAKAITTHNADATWTSFMRGTHVRQNASGYAAKPSGLDTARHLAELAADSAG